VVSIVLQDSATIMPIRGSSGLSDIADTAPADYLRQEQIQFQIFSTPKAAMQAVLMPLSTAQLHYGR